MDRVGNLFKACACTLGAKGDLFAGGCQDCFALDWRLRSRQRGISVFGSADLGDCLILRLFVQLIGLVNSFIG